MALTTAPKAAQAATNGFVVPFFRGSANSEYGYWENFASLYGGSNLPDQLSATTGAGLVPNNSDIFDIGNGNIYSFDAATDFTLTGSTPFTLGTVVLQTSTRGSEPDYNSVILSYNVGGVQTLAPLSRYELSRPHAGMDGSNVSSLFQWDLTGLGITDYTIAASLCHHLATRQKLEQIDYYGASAKLI